MTGFRSIFFGQEEKIYWFFFLTLLAVFAGCANPVAPTGGVKDETPPAVVRSDPQNGSAHFSAREIKIWFNEYIVLKNLQEQFLCSPPFDQVPEIKVRGKTLVVSIEESLKPNTTYTLFFGDAITDLNEGNILRGFKYIFSTGPVLDSMELSGEVLNAFMLSPEKEINVMLYDVYTDSVPYLQTPYYISRTNKNGEFSFTHLRNMPYKIFALRDLNSNLLFDLPKEEIAFSDTLIYPIAPAPKIPADSLVNSDSLKMENSGKTETHKTSLSGGKKNEKSQTASTQSTEEIPSAHAKISLRLFSEVDSTQRIEKSAYIYPNKIEIIFRYPVRNIDITTYPPTEASWRIDEWNQGRDTLWLWLQNVSGESLQILVNNHKPKTDTLEFNLEAPKTGRGLRAELTEKSVLQVKSKLPFSSPAHLHTPVILTFSEPIGSYRKEQIHLVQDSIIIRPSLDFIDPAKRTLLINHPWKEATSYKILIPDSVFFGVYGNTHDTLQFRFKTREMNEYGSIKIKLRHTFQKEEIVVHLLDEKDQILSQKHGIPDGEAAVFSYLLPGKYKVRIIRDGNQNRKWDTGIYLKALQPESVYLFSATIEVRANWDVEETFSIPE